MNYKLPLNSQMPHPGIGSGQTAPQEYYAAEVIFGSPEKNCAGAGICKVLSPVAHRRASGCLNCRRANALISTGPLESLLFRFVRQSMSREMIQENFGSGFFLVENAFHFQLAPLQQPGRITIAPGVYPVVQSPGFLNVWFKGEKRKDKTSIAS